MCDINITRKDGYAEITPENDAGKLFMETLYGGQKLILEDSCLVFFNEYTDRMGLTSRFIDGRKNYT